MIFSKPAHAFIYREFPQSSFSIFFLDIHCADVPHLRDAKNRIHLFDVCRRKPNDMIAVK